VVKTRFERTDSPVKIVLIYMALMIMSIITVYPVLNILSVALRPGNSLFSTSLAIIPHNATLENFRVAIFERDLLLWIKNSFIIAVMTSIFGVVFSVGAAYAFSRYKFWGKKTGLMVFLVTQMFPAPMLLLPLYIIVARLKLQNSFIGLLIPYISLAVPFMVWMLKGYFDTIPRSLEESAYIDGAGVMESLYKIVLPLATPALAISALFSFMTAWSEFIVANIIMKDAGKLTLPVGLVHLQGQFGTEWGVYSAAALITTIPVMVLFISLSKYLIGGLTLGSVKG
jgi:arabinogalactan oligomer/maltooligosaccharide transport system permease protein